MPVAIFLLGFCYLYSFTTFQYEVHFVNENRKTALYFKFNCTVIMLYFTPPLPLLHNPSADPEGRTGGPDPEGRTGGPDPPLKNLKKYKVS